jgi:hypothetical protein
LICSTRFQSIRKKEILFFSREKISFAVVLSADGEPIDRVDDQKILAYQVSAWQDYRNKHHAKANWQFTTADARVKLKRLYQFE